MIHEELRAILDEQARRYLNMSGAEFERAWSAGEVNEPNRPEVTHVAMLRPEER